MARRRRDRESREQKPRKRKPPSFIGAAGAVLITLGLGTYVVEQTSNKPVYVPQSTTEQSSLEIAAANAPMTWPLLPKIAKEHGFDQANTVRDYLIALSNGSPAMGEFTQGLVQLRGRVSDQRAFLARKDQSGLERALDLGFFPRVERSVVYDLTAEQYLQRHPQNPGCTIEGDVRAVVHISHDKSGTLFGGTPYIFPAFHRLHVSVKEAYLIAMETYMGLAQSVEFEPPLESNIHQCQHQELMDYAARVAHATYLAVSHSTKLTKIRDMRTSHQILRDEREQVLRMAIDHPTLRIWQKNIVDAYSTLISPPFEFVEQVNSKLGSNSWRIE